MNVLHIATEKSWRGGENQLRHLISGLAAQGVKNHVVVQPESSAAKIFAEFAETFPVKMRNDLDVLAAMAIARLCRQNKIEIIHAHTARAHALGLLTKWLLKLTGPTAPKLVVHRRVEHTATFNFKQKLKYQNSDVDHYVCVSKAIARGMATAGIVKEKISVVYSAVDPTPYSQMGQVRHDVRTELGLADHEFVVCSVGAIEPAKGVDYLIDGWIRYLDNSPQTQSKLLMVGEGESRPLLEGKTRESKFADTVLFTGFRRDVARLMMAADVLILPTLWEGLGTVLLDGLLAGCAVIGSNVGGVPEIIKDGETGILIPARDSQAIADAISRLAVDPELRKKMVQLGRAHIAANFTLETMIAGNLRVYRLVQN